MFTKLKLLLMALWLSQAVSQTVIINEFLASNVTSNPEMIDFDDYSDWIELYNINNDPIVLDGYFITDDFADPLKWRIPDNTVINGEGFLLLWADDYDEVPGRTHTRPYWPWDNFTTQNYHTNFKLSKSGEQLGLFQASQSETFTIIEDGSLWKYLDDGSDQDSAWIAIGFDDDSWESGYAELGYGDGDEATVVEYGPDEDNKYITTYFRKVFTIDETEYIHEINARLLRDDGAIVYLNGIEIIRDNMPTGIISYDTQASDAVSASEEETFHDWSVPVSLLNNGQNIIAVEIHQVDESSSDISFNLELVATTYADIVLIDSLSFGNQLTDVSFGRNPSDQSWSYFGEPTPGAPNNTTPTINTEISGPVQISIDPGFYENSITVELSTSSNTEQIYYTLDGSKPVSESSLYSGPIVIESTTVLKTRSIENGKLPGKINSSTYFISENSHIPTISLMVEPETLWDEEIGIYENEYKQREIPITLSYFSEVDELGFTVNAGARLGGENIWTKPQKPFTIYTRNRFGDDFINYRLFDNKQISRFSRIVLRNGGDDWEETLIRDPLTESLVSGMMRCGYMAYKPSSVFLNGSYWGIHNIREKFDKNYFSENFNADPDNIDHLEYSRTETGTELLIVEGTMSHYNEMIDYLMSNNINDPAIYDQVQEWMDIDSFIDHLVMTMYCANTSWGHNREWWRPRTENGKWKWLIVDLDRGFNIFNVFTNLLDNLMEDYELFNLLLNSSSFQNRFVQRASSHLNNTFHYQRINASVDSLSAIIAPEMPRHITKWGDQGGVSSMSDWEDELNEIKQFAENRTSIVRNQLSDELDLNETISVTVNIEPSGFGKVLINDVPKIDHNQEENFFKDIPISISAFPKPGYEFVGWEGLTDSNHIQYDCNSDGMFTAVFQFSDEIILQDVVTENTVLESYQSYVVEENITINPGVNLTIPEGVKISMPEDGNIIVEGQLIINGTEQNPVEILPHNSAQDNRWGAICFNNATDSSSLSHLKLEGASVGIDPSTHKGAISGVNSDISISHAEIEDVLFPVYLEGGSLHINQSSISCDFICDFINVKGGDAFIEECTFFGSLAPDTDAIDLDNVTNGIIIRNKIYDFQGTNSDGIDIGENSQNIDIVSNLIYHSYDKGISIGQKSSVNAFKNLIVGGNNGIAVKDSSSAYILSNTFFNNDTSISCFEKNEGAGGGTAEVVNTILSNNLLSSVYTDELSSASVRYSLSDTELLDGEGNLFADPIFVNSGSYNLEIAPHSPCIDSGDPNGILDDDGSNPDMGAYYNYDINDYPFGMVDSLISELKINELLARNDSVNTDESGEFDDWLELFNPTDQPLNLAGLYLTDDLSELTKWQFSDSMDVIMPGDYLLIWCDEDISQGNQHTNFKLSADGETVVLTSGNGITIIDSISYGTQISNQSFGRIQDGESEWGILYPTPAYSNIQLGTVENGIIPKNFYLFQNFPNPFNPQTIIRYNIPRNTFVSLTIYDLMGRIIAQPINAFQSPGKKFIKWDATNNHGESVSAGVYLYRVEAGDYISTRKMVLLK